MAGGDARDLQLWGGVAVVGAALAVVAGYLADGAPLVWAVASIEVLLVMVFVGRRFRYMAQRRALDAHASPANSAHCERCHRARELHDGLAARRGASSAGRRAQDRASESPRSADRVVRHQ